MAESRWYSPRHKDTYSYPNLTPTVVLGGFQAAWVFDEEDHGYTMKKNVAGQAVGCQMVSATDGSAFTGSVTVSVTGDAGVQATGSVGAGACTHEGNGYHTYAPAQAETNYTVVAFTFTGSGAVPRTREIYTSFPQTGDNYARIGAPAGASIAADIAGLQTDTDDIQTRLPAALVSGRMDSSTGAMAANVLTAAATAADFDAEIAAAIWQDTTAGDFTVAASIGKSVMNGVALGTGLTINGYTGNTVQTGDAFARIGANGSGLTATDDATLAAIAALNNLSAAQVNAEVVDALATDTYAEPGQGDPAATTTIAAKLNYLYKWTRNKKDNDGTKTQFYADDASTVDHVQTTSVAGGVVTKGEIATGP